MTNPTTTPSRAEMAEWYRDDVTMAAAQFLGVTHDIDSHYYGAGDGSGLEYYSENLADVVLGLIERTQRAALHAAEEIGAATARRDWLLSRGPLRCSTCGEHIDPVDDPWRVCDGLAEHDTCHHDDRAAEVQERAWQREDDEHGAYLEDRTRSGPRFGDRVRLTYGDGGTVEGTWTADGDQAAVRLDDGTVHHHVTGQVAREVVDLAQDIEDQP